MAISFIHEDKKNIPVYNFNQFEPYLDRKNDTTYIINFWATWCIPCRKELPDFEKINAENKNKAVKVILVSLDMSENIQKSLVPFLEKYNIKSNVIVLDDPNSNSWINKIDPSWNGTIPATLIYNSNYRDFFPHPLTYSKLDSIINLKSNKI